MHDELTWGVQEMEELKYEVDEEMYDEGEEIPRIEMDG